MRLFRVYFYPRKVVIYHTTWSDIRRRMQCIIGSHEYLTVMEYQSVGAKEERCLHCLRARYSFSPQLTSVGRLT